MAILYLTEAGTSLKKEGYLLKITKNGVDIAKTSLEKLEAVVLFSGAHITSPVMIELLKREIPLTYLSSKGEFYGRLESTSGINIERQILQFQRSQDKSFCLEMSKKLILAKVKNGVVVLKRFNRNKKISGVDEKIREIQNVYVSIEKAENLETLMGIEGSIAKQYFSILGEIVPDEFKFLKRSKQPPKDPFNSLLGFTYTLMLYEIYSTLVSKGLHPYIGVMHKIKKGHPALASDLIEEWRSSFCDSFVISIISNKIINKEDFVFDEKSGGVYLNEEKRKIFIKKFEERMKASFSYITNDNTSNVRDAILHQVNLLVKSIENNDVNAYRSMIIR
jgi:CRISP-associated protein Cas1